MNPVTIAPEDSISYTDFSEGNPVQIRVSVPAGQAKNFGKGQVVKVIYQDTETKGRIVSDPIVISKDIETEKVLSLIVEKAEAF